MGLNHIYKVIWSKTKNAWVVVSEIAKRDGKSSVKSVVTSLAGKSVAAVMVAMVMCGGVASANTVYGTGASAYGTAQHVTAIGENATAQANEVVAVGYNSQVMGYTGGIAIGSSAHALSIQRPSIAIGAGASTSNYGSIAIGSTASSSGTSSVAIGNGALSSSTNTTAIGDSSIADKNSATAVGYYSQAKGEYSLAVGYGAGATGNNSVILGSGAGSTKEGSVVVGYNSVGNGKDTIVIGRQAGASVDNAVVLGSQAGTTYANSVVIGQGSEGNHPYQASASVNINGINIDSSNFAGTAGNITSGHFVSIGSAGKERQIKNVAAGVISATSTDAINGSQLYEAVRAVTAGASPDVYMHVNDGTLTQGAGNATTNLGKANEKGGATGNRSIAIGVGSQASGLNSVVIGSEVKSASDNIVAIGNPAAGSSTIGSNSMGATLIGYNSIISNNSASSSVFGSNSSVLGTSSVAINNASVNGTNSVAINGAAGRFLGINQFTSNNAVAINGVAKGNNNIAIGGSVGYSKVGDSYLVSGSNFSTPSENSIAIGNNTLVTQKNTVMVGTYDKEYTAKANTDKNKVITPALHTAYYTLGAVDKQYYEGTLNNSIYLGHESYAFTPDALVDDESHLTGEQSIHTKKYDATGNIVVSNNTTGGAFGKVSKATINGDEITGFAGSQSVGAVTIGAGDYERRIQNVAAGEVSATSTDGINGSQLYAVANTLSKNMSSYMHINDGTSTQTVGNATTNYGYSGSKAGATGTKSIAGGVNAQAAGVESIALGQGATASGNYTLAQGSGATASSVNSIALGYGASVNTSATGSIAIGGNAKVKNYHGVAIGMGSVVDSSYAVVLGDGSVSSNSEGAIAINNNVAQNSTSSVGINGTVSDNSPRSFSSLGYVQGGYNINLGGLVGYNDYVPGLTPGVSDTIAKLPVTNSVAVGNGSNVTSNNTIVIGKSSRTFYAAGTRIGARSSRNASDFISPTKVASSLIMTGASQGDVYLDGTLENSVYLGVNSEAITKDSLVDGENSSSGENSIHTKKYDSAGNIVVSNNTTGGAFGKVSKATINGDEITGFAGAQSVGAVTIGAGDYERRIQNVAAGEVSATSTDGINGSQLYAVADTLSKNMSSYMHINDGTSTQTVGNATTNYGYSGSKAGATGTKSIAGGMNAQAAGEQALAMGTSAEASGKNSIAQGSSANASAEDAIAIGNGAKASGEKSISIGTGNEVKGNKSSAIGDPSYIDTTATGTHVQGNDNGTATNPIKASESTFMGNTNLAGTAGTTGIHVVGNNNSVDSSNVMVMGNNVTVGTGLDGAVVLGHASSADQYAAATDSTINGVTFEAAGYAGNTGLNKGSIVSVGATGTERQIKNVAAGAVTATSTDAVNGSQLYKTAETILKMPINMAGDSGDTVGLKLGKTVNIKGSVASGADVTDGNIAVVGDKATSTLSLKMAKNLTGLTSGTFTDASGNQTVINGAGVTVTPTGTGATPISITTSGINAGNQEIKGVKKGTTDDAAVNKKQMDDALAGISSTLTINDGTTDGSVNIKTGKLKVVGESGANALVTTTVSGDTISVGTSTKLQNAVTAAEKSADKDLSNLSATGSGTVKTLAQDAVKVAGTGLATVSDATAAGVKTYTVNVDEGKLVIDDTTGKVGAAGATQGTTAGKDGVATTQNVASVVNSAIDKTKQALDDAKHNFAGDDATVISRKHGEQLNIKGGASTTATDLTSGNIAVVGDTTSGTLNIKMAKALTGLTSATYTDAAGNTQTVTGGSSTIADAAGNSTVVSKGGVTTTDAAGNTTTTAPTGVTVTPAGAGATPISVTTSGISAGNKEIKNVGKATTDDAAVNKKQMDDALKGATDNTVSLGSESGSTTAKKLSTTGGIKFNIKGETGANALITTSATGDDVTIAPTAKLTAAVTAAEKSADKDLSNLSVAGDTYIKNLAKTAASWNVETNGAGTTAVAGGDTVNFIDGDNIAITNTGRSITIGTAKNVSFDKVTVGGVVIDKTDGINAGGKEIKGVATGTAADSAVNKAQMDAAITAAAGGALSTEKVVAKTLTGDNNLATVTGQTGNAKGETYEVSVSENAVKAVAQTAAQDAVKVAGTGLATVSDATAAGVKTYTVNVEEGKLVIDDTTGKVGAAGSTQGTTTGKNGVATTQDVASVVNSAIDKTKQALTDAKHDFAGDDATVISRKHGEQLNIKGGASTTATDLTSGNIAVVGDTTTGTLNIKLAKALTGLTSATYTDAAGNTQTVTGGSSTISDAAGNSTVVSKGGVTTTDGTNTTTVAPSGVTATDGTHTVTLGGSGISAGGTEIKNVGKATTDDAAVNKKQMDDAVKAATDSVSTLGDNKVSLGSDSGTTTAKKLSTTGGIKFNIKGDTGANALITTSATGDDVTIAPTAKLTAAVTAAEKSADKDLSNISPAGETVIKNLAATSAQDAVKVTGTGLATVSDSTTGGVKTYNVDVKTGNLVVTAAGQAGATGTTGAGGAAGADGVATTQNVASAINDAITKSKTDTAQAIADAEHKFDGDTGTTSVRKHGEVLSIKGGVTATTDLTTGNIGVVSDGAGTLNIRLAKVLSGLTSATYTDGAGNTQTVTGGSSTISDAAGNSTVVSKGGVTTTDGTNTTTVAPSGVTATDGTHTVTLGGAGISAGGTEIKNVGKATTDDAAVNKKQMDDAVKAATDSISTLGDNKVSLGSDSGTTTAKKLSTTGGIKFNIKGDTGANALITTSATGDDVTIAPTAKLTAAVTAAEKSADKDLSNLSAAGDTYIKNLAKTAASWNVETNGGGTTAVAGGDTVNFINGDNIAITNTGQSITIGTAKNVSFDKVTVGGIVLDKNTGINAGGKEIKGVANATSADAAVNKGQLDAAVLSAAGGALSIEKVEAGSVANGKLAAGDNNLASVSGLTGTAKNETYTVTVSENAVKAVAQTAAQDAVKVAGTGLATVSDATAAGVKTYTVNVDEGKLVIDDTTGKIGANGATQGTVQGKNGVATTQDVASVVNSAIDKTKQALTDAKHDFAGDDATVISRKHGEQLNIKGGASTTATDLTSGNIAVVGDTTTGTLNIKLAKALTGLTSATYTDAAGNTQTVTGGSSTITDGAGNTTTITKGGMTTTDGTNTTTVASAGVTATDGTNTVKLTGSGIDAGNTQIKNVGKATTDDAAVNKKQMDDAVKAATDSISTLGDNKVSLGSDSGTTTAKKLSTTGGIKFNIKGDTGANALITTSATGDDVTIAPTAKLTAAVTAAEKSADKDLSNISTAGETVIKNLAATSAQDAVKVTGTGLATVSDSTTGGVKTYNVDVKTGNLVVNAAGQAGATGTTGAGGATGADGVATTQNVATAINDAITKSKTDTAQAIADAEHKFDGDTGTTSVRKHGEVLSIKGGVTNTADLTTGNIGVVSDGAGTLNIRLAKTLTGLTSAAFTDGTHTVTIAGSGIDAGNTEIKHVGKATTDDAAVNKKQMDDAVKAATDSVTTLGDNKVSLGSDSGTTTAKKLSTTGGIKFNIKGDTGANALITTSATGDDVTIAPTAKLSAAVTAAENSANKDLSNLSTAGNTYIQNLAKSAASWNVETNGGGTTAVAGGDTVNFINGDNIAITNTGRSITIGTAKNVSFDKVTVGGVVIDKNNGIDAGGKEITNVGPATSGNSAVNKTQMDTAITNAVNKATTDAKHDFGGDDATVVTRKHGEKLNIKGGASTTAADLTSGNIAVLGDAATGTLNIRMAKALTGLSSATFTTPSGTTVINGGGMTITPSTTGAAPISITTGGINAGNTEIKNVAAGTTATSAVNKQQMDNAISNATANVGFNTAGNTGTGSVTNGQTLTITGTNGIETNASGQSITVGLDAATRAQINNATTTANNAAKKDLSNIDNAGKQVIKDTAAWNVKVNSGTPEIVKGGDTVTFNDGDNIKVTNTGKDITIATKKDVSFDKVTVGNVVIDKNTNRISGLANAANNDEAVNLGQMNAAISTATAGTGNIKYKANGGTQNSVALTTGFDFKGDSNIQITADPANSGVVNYKLNPALTGITSISGGTGAPTITLNAGSGSNPGNVSINSNLDMGGKQINNIGAATHAGDAVNKAQMDQALQNIAGASSNAAKSYAYKAGAGAAALAALKPIQYDPLEPTQIMAGIGNYKSQTAVALGVAHYTNENTMFNLGVSLDSHDGIVNAGVTHKFGYSPEKKAIPDKYKGGPISSIYVMQDEVTALQAIVQKQAAENEALRQQNEDMQRKVDMILSKIH